MMVFIDNDKHSSVYQQSTASIRSSTQMIITPQSQSNHSNVARDRNIINNKQNIDAYYDTRLFSRNHELKPGHININVHIINCISSSNITTPNTPIPESTNESACDTAHTPTNSPSISPIIAQNASPNQPASVSLVTSLHNHVFNWCILGFMGRFTDIW